MAPRRALSSLLLLPASRQRSYACTRSIKPSDQYSFWTRSVLSRPPQLKPSVAHTFPKRFNSTTSHPEPDDPQPPDYLSNSELHVFHKLRKELGPSKLEVQDISGGCGTMFAIDVVSKRFEGLSVIKQHRLVNEVLREEIAWWHGLQLKTKTP